MNGQLADIFTEFLRYGRMVNYCDLCALTWGGVLTWEEYWAQSCVLPSDLSTLRLVWTQFISPQVNQRACMCCTVIWFTILFSTLQSKSKKLGWACQYLTRLHSLHLRVKQFFLEYRDKWQVTISTRICFLTVFCKKRGQLVRLSFEVLMEAFLQLASLAKKRSTNPHYRFHVLCNRWPKQLPNIVYELKKGWESCIGLEPPSLVGWFFSWSWSSKWVTFKMWAPNWLPKPGQNITC